MIDELDKLKGAWQVASESSDTYSLEAIRKMVKKRSKNELSKIQRKLIIESITSILLSFCFIFYVHYIDSTKTFISGLYILLVMGVSLIPYFKILRFSYGQNRDLKSHLSLFISQFDRLVSQYIKMYVFLIPIAIFGAYMLGFVIGVDSGMSEYEFRLMDVLIGLLIIVGITLMGYAVLRKYFNWIYGKNLERLRDCLSELEEVED